MSVSIEVKLTGFETVMDALSRLSPLDTGTLLEGLARLIQQQTRERIYTEKTAPDGTPWTANNAGSSILLADGTLARSIDYAVQGESAVVGSGLIYSRIHQLGGTIKPKSKKNLAFQLGGKLILAMKVVMPARPYLGISADNASEILEAVADFVRRKLG